jgi:lipopolysaccharide exporter
VLAYSLTRHPLTPSWRRAQATHWRYGARHTAISFSEFVSANLATVLIGRLLGEQALGLYNRAQVLAYQPVEKAAGIITRVLFPVVAALQRDPAKVGQIYILGFGFIGVWAGAVSLSLYAAAPDVVALLLGPQWSDAVPVVRLLSLAVPAIFISNISGVLCDAMDFLQFKLRLQLAGMTVILALMLILSPLGVAGIVGGLVIGEWIRVLVYFSYLAKRLKYRHRDCLRSVAAVAGGSLFAWCLVCLALGAAHDGDLALAWRLVLVILSGLVGLAGGLILLWGLLDPAPAGQLAREHVPGWRGLNRLVKRGHDQTS